MEKVDGMEVARREETRAGGGEGRGMQQTREVRGGLVSWSEELQTVRCVCSDEILEATHWG